MNFSQLIDWGFFWKVFNNFLYSAMPFILIIVAIIGLGLLIEVIVSAVKKARSS